MPSNQDHISLKLTAATTSSPGIDSSAGQLAYDRSQGNPGYSHHQTSFTTPLFWLLGIVAGFAAIQVHLVLQAPQLNLLDHSLLPWAVTGMLIWQHRWQISLTSGILGTSLGLGLLGLLLFKAGWFAQSVGYPAFTVMLPLLSMLGVVLLVAGLPGCRRYAALLIVLFFLGPAVPLLPRLVADLTALTAKSAAVGLWYVGFEVGQQGTYIILPSGFVDVNEACSGLQGMAHLFGIALAFLVMFPVRRWASVIAPLVALCLGFMVNVTRVAWLAVLVARDDQVGFNYWHAGEGSTLFSIFSIVIFVMLYLFCLPPDRRSTKPISQP